VEGKPKETDEKNGIQYLTSAQISPDLNLIQNNNNAAYIPLIS
jgi:hypothetical protein